MAKYGSTFVKYPQIALRGLKFRCLAVKNISYWFYPGVVVKLPQNIHFRGAKGSAGKKKEVQEEEESLKEEVDLNSVCAGLNYYKTGEDPLIRADNEYPVWLWTCLNSVKTYKEIPPELEKAYMRRQNKMKARNNNALKKELLGKS